MNQPSSPTSAASQAERIYARWQLERELGAAESLEELCARHSAHESELRALHGEIEDLREVEAQARLGGGRSHEATASHVEAELGRHGASPQRYQVGEILGRGGMGEVRKAEDLLLRRTVAYKVLLEPELRHERLPLLRREMLLAARLCHPNIVPVWDAGLDGQGRAYYTMPLIVGRNLSDVYGLHAEGDPEWGQARVVSLLLQVAETMAHAHAQGVVHRDLKPDNVRVGEHGAVHVMDWGVAKSIGATVHERGPGSPSDTEYSEPRIGTLAYMSPEQRLGAGAVAASTDVYALGAMMHELLVGAPPYMRAGEGRIDTNELRRRIESGSPRSASELAPRQPAELLAICERALQPQPERRYRDCAALAADLRAYLEGRVVAAHEVGAWAESKKWVRRNKALAASLGAGMLFLVTGFVLSRAAMAEAEDKAEQLQAANKRHEATLLELREVQLGLRRQSAEQAYTVARMHAQRGEWKPCLASIELARQLDHPGSDALLALAADAHLGLGDLAAAEASIDGLSKAQGPVAASGSALLLRARIALSRGQAQSEIAKLAGRALEAGLSPGEAALARGLTARGLAASIEHYEQAVLLQPSLREAHDQLTSALLMTGRLEEAESAISRHELMYPDDPSTTISSTMLFALNGESKQAHARLRESRDKLDPATHDAARSMLDAIKLANAIPMELFTGHPPENQFQMLGLMNDARRVLAGSLSHGGHGAIGFMRPNFASHREGWQAAFSLQWHLAEMEQLGHGLGDIDLMIPLADARERVRELSADSEDPVVLMSHAFDRILAQPEGYFGDPVRSRTSALELMELLERAGRAGSLFPAFTRASNYWLVRLCRAQGDQPGSKERALEAIKRARRHPLTYVEALDYSATVMHFGDGGLALDIVDDYLARHPARKDVQRARIGLLIREGAQVKAIEHADAYLAKWPNDVDVRDLRLAAVASLRARLDELQSAPSDPPAAK